MSHSLAHSCTSDWGYSPAAIYSKPVDTTLNSNTFSRQIQSILANKSTKLKPSAISIVNLCNYVEYGTKETLLRKRNEIVFPLIHEFDSSSDIIAGFVINRV